MEAISSQILGYKLNWARTGSDLLQAARIAVSFDTLFYNITGLNNKLSYDIIVWAYSKGGDGPFIMTSQVPSCKLYMYAWLNIQTNKHDEQTLS